MHFPIHLVLTAFLLIPLATLRTQNFLPAPSTCGSAGGFGFGYGTFENLLGTVPFTSRNHDSGLSGEFSYDGFTAVAANGSTIPGVFVQVSASGQWLSEASVCAEVQACANLQMQYFARIVPTTAQGYAFPFQTIPRL